MGKGGYGLTYQEVYEMENLTIEAKAIYGMLCSYAGSKAMAYPSVDFICDKLKINVMIDNLKCDDRISSRIMETSTVLAMPEFSVRKKKADERNEAFLRGILEE